MDVDGGGGRAGFERGGSDAVGRARGGAEMYNMEVGDGRAGARDIASPRVARDGDSVGDKACACRTTAQHKLVGWARTALHSPARRRQKLAHISRGLRQHLAVMPAMVFRGQDCRS